VYYIIKYTILKVCISDVDDVEGVRVVVFNIIFNNIAVILWWSVLLVEETRAPGENHRPITSD